MYVKTYNEAVQILRNAQYENEKEINVVTKDVTLDEWYEIWMNTCKGNCRSSKSNNLYLKERLQKNSIRS